MNVVESRGRCWGIAMVLCLLFGWGASAAAEEPFLTNLTFLPGDDVIAPAAGKQLSPEIAPGGPGFLAVWVDERTSLTSLIGFTGGPYFHPHIGSMWDIYAARLDAQGNLIDEAPIVVAQQILNQGMPDVAWNGENWLVVWSGQKGMACCSDIHLYAARVSPEGVVLDQDPIEVDPISDDIYWPTVGSDGTNWLVVWRDWDLQAGVATLDGTRIAPDGTVLDPGGVYVRHDTYNSYPVDPDLAWAGDEYLLVWEEDSGQIAGQRLGSDLTKIGPVFTINTYGPSQGHNPRVATDGTDFFVTYWEDRYYGWSQLFGVRVTHDGTILDTGGIEITDFADYTNFEPAVDYDGTNYVVVYGLGGFDYDLYTTRVAVDGTVVDPQGIPISIASYYHTSPAVASGPGGLSIALWEDPRFDGSSQDGDIFAASISGDGSIGEHFCASLGAPRQTQLRTTVSGDGFAAVFRSETSLASRIVLQRLDASGYSVDAEPIEIASGDFHVGSPSVAWNGSLYLVVWGDTGLHQIFGRRVDASGVALDTDPIAILPGDAPDVAALGGAFLVVSSHEDPHEIRRPKAVRVDSEGQVQGSPVTIGSSYALGPRVVPFGARWLAVWEQWPTHDNTRANIYGAFVGEDGLGQGSFLVTYDAIAASSKPVIAAAADTALIVWHDNRQAPERKDLYYRRILPGGTLLDPQGGVRITAAANSQFDASAAWDGERYVLAFGDFRNDSELDQHRGDIYGARIEGSGQIIDPDGFPVLDASIPEMIPSVSASGGIAVLGASVFHDDAPLVAYRIGIRVAGLDPASAPEDAFRAGAVLRVHPNPASVTSGISLSLAESGPATVAIYDLRGRLVTRLAERTLPAGTTRLEWDGRGAGGRRAAPGIYFLRVRAHGESLSAKILRR